MAADPGAPWRAAALALVAGATGVWLLDFPVAPVALGLGLLAAACVVAWRPVLIWLLVPAALPLLDWAPWSGRLFFDEFDALLALLTAVAWWRSPPAHRSPPDRLLQLALLAVAASYALGTVRALLPWPGVSPDAFANLLGPFNALRVARGAAWALLLWALARRQQDAGLDIYRPFGGGLVLGLLGTVLFILWERAAFSHWADFSDGYRVAGPFSAMHTGGAYVEAFLVCTLPFLVSRMLPPAPWWRMALGGPLLGGGIYALAVTFSRSGYAALALGLVVVLTMAPRQRGHRLSRWLGGAALAGLAAAVAAPVMLGSFAQSRLATIHQDLGTREAHWARAYKLMDADTTTRLLGMGVGRFPAVDLLNSPPDTRSGSYRLVAGQGRHHLQLGSGQPLYLEQLVSIEPHRRYRLQLRLRGGAPDAALTVQLCEKWLLSSAICAGTTVAAGSTGPGWTDLERWIDPGEVGAGGDFGSVSQGLPRTVKLSFSLAGPAVVDLASIQLSAPDGRALLQNGDFSQGMDHWFFTSDAHLAWHAKMLPLALLFDQGLLGLLAMTGLLGLGLVRAGRAAWQGDGRAVPVFAALLSLAVVGVVDTLIDNPRFLMLWLLLCCFAAGLQPPAASRRGA